MNIDPLLDEAFLSDEAGHATPAIDAARARVSNIANVGAFSLEVVVPDAPDEDWLRERVLRPLVYFCESTGVPAPACTGVFVTFFRGGRIHCVLGGEVIAWSARELGLDVQAIVDRSGTGEREHAARRAPT
ncbi:MAG TPA: STAUR_1299 family protein [Ideonella sp.]|nr:STAUR_1299 family protein [Ideonella sp.]